MTIMYSTISIDEEQQPDVVNKMNRPTGKFDGTGFDEWDDHAPDCVTLRCHGIV